MRPAVEGPPPFTTLVELTWREKRVEYWIRFGRQSYEHVLDRHRRLVGFAPGSIFAFIRWAANDYGTVLSRIDIVRVIERGMLEIIDAIEAIGIDACDVVPDHWRHVHHRIAAGLEPHAYTTDRHAAWLKRRSVKP
jgi:hypothetical protein